MQKQRFTTTIGNKDLHIEVGAFAQSANASCLVQMGDTVVMATAVMSDSVRDGNNFLPLMVDYEEKLYAAGRIKGSRFIKREGRPTDNAVLVGRFIDRAIRPLFNQSIRYDIQVIVTTLAFDELHDPDVLGLIAASTALHISDIPWGGPIGAVRMSKVNDTWLANATYEERLKTQFDLDLAGTGEKIVMIEAEAEEASEADLLDGFKRGTKVLDGVIALIEEVRSAVGKPKMAFAASNDKREVESAMREFIIPRINEALFSKPIITKSERNAIKSELTKEAKAHFEALEWPKEDVRHALGMMYDLVLEAATNQILDSDRRIDGRAIDEIRPLTIDVGLLPRVHGSGHFNRGGTQVLSIATLGAPGDKQTLDDMELVEEKRYMHHYNFPPFSVGEAKPLRGASRRDIGHGALAEKALRAMIPSAEEFPYTIRVVSEVLDSNGSSSMASTCGSTLALMDAGVPIKKPVAGIAMGLASNERGWKIITDLQDLEDGPGGMDFKITGTVDGITAIQMDTKTTGLTMEMIEKTLEQAKTARLSILESMRAVIAEPRAELSPFAPRILSLTINPEKIREVIGPGGKMINEIIEKTGVDAIDIEQDGTVMITAKNIETAQKAYDWVHNLTRDIQAGELFDGKVVRIMDFGAFVEVLPGKDGLVHVSELAPWRVAKVDDIVKIDDIVKVKVIEIDDQGRINLSMKQAEGNVYTEAMKAKAATAPSRPAGPRPFASKPPRRD
jgi:polyribonucleotide nucleotidyltransferase